MEKFFSGYILNLFSVCICAFLCKALCSFDGSGSSQQGLKLITGLCVFISVVLPFCSTIRQSAASLSEGLNIEPQSQYTISEEFYNQTKIQFQERYISEIYNATGILADSISIEFTTSDDSFEFKRIEVVLKNASTEDAEKIKEYIRQTAHHNADVKIISS